VMESRASWFNHVIVIGPSSVPVTNQLLNGNLSERSLTGHAAYQQPPGDL
jgi:hypothetical protein